MSQDIWDGIAIVLVVAGIIALAAVNAVILFA